MTEEKNMKAETTARAKADADADTKMAETIQKLFKTELSPMEFANGLSQMPELGAVLRHAGLQDARTMAGVRLTSARIEAVRAKAVGDPRAEARAERSKAHAEFLAAAAKREEERSRPVEAMLGQLKGVADQFRVVGKVVDQKGRPVPNARVELSGAKSGTAFKVETDDNGIYDLKIPVGKDSGKADEGEDFVEKVLAKDAKLDGDVKGRITAGAVKLHNVTLPLKKTMNVDLAAPIAKTRPSVKPAPKKRTSKGKSGS